MKWRLTLALVLTAVVVVWAQVGPLVGLRIPVWDWSKNAYAYLTLDEFRPLILSSGGVRYTLPATPPVLGEVLGLPKVDEAILVCKVPALVGGVLTSTCGWAGPPVPAALALPPASGSSCPGGGTWKERNGLTVCSETADMRTASWVLVPMVKQKLQALK